MIITAATLCNLTGINKKRLSRWVRKGLIAPIEPIKPGGEGRYHISEVKKVRFLCRAREALRDCTLDNLSEMYDQNQINLKHGFKLTWGAKCRE